MNIWIKRIAKSKTMWLSVIGAVVITLEASLGILQPVLPVNAYAVISVILAVGGAVLRVVTTQPLNEKA